MVQGVNINQCSWEWAYQNNYRNCRETGIDVCAACFLSTLLQDWGNLSFNYWSWIKLYCMAPINCNYFETGCNCSLLNAITGHIVVVSQQSRPCTSRFLANVIAVPAIPNKGKQILWDTECSWKCQVSCKKVTHSNLTHDPRAQVDCSWGLTRGGSIAALSSAGCRGGRCLWLRAGWWDDQQMFMINNIIVFAWST